MKDYRENYFKELGFSNIVIERDARVTMRTLTLMAATLLLAACNTTPRSPLVGADRGEHGYIGSAELSMVGAGRQMRCVCSSRAFASTRPMPVRPSAPSCCSMHRSESGRAGPCQRTSRSADHQGEGQLVLAGRRLIQLFLEGAMYSKSGDHVLLSRRSDP